MILFGRSRVSKGKCRVGRFSDLISIDLGVHDDWPVKGAMHPNIQDTTPSGSWHNDVNECSSLRLRQLTCDSSVYFSPSMKSLMVCSKPTSSKNPRLFARDVSYLAGQLSTIL